MHAADGCAGVAMIVLDASAAVEIAKDTVQGRALRYLIDDDEEVIAPISLIPETTNAISKYVRGRYLSSEAGKHALDVSIGIVDEFHDVTELYGEALSESVRLGHSAYDLFYLILARRHSATLFTLDRKLQEVCLECGVDCVFTDVEF